MVERGIGLIKSGSNIPQALLIHRYSDSGSGKPFHTLLTATENL